MHTNYRLFVLIESDAVMLILSAGQQEGIGRGDDRPASMCHIAAAIPEWPAGLAPRPVSGPDSANV